MEQLTIIGKSIIRIGESLSSLITPLINAIAESPKHESNKKKALRMSRKLKYGIYKGGKSHRNKTKKHKTKHKSKKHSTAHTRKLKLKSYTHKKK